MSYATAITAIGTPTSRLQFNGNITCDYGYATTGTYVQGAGIVTALSGQNSLECVSTNVNVTNHNDWNLTSVNRKIFSFWFQADAVSGKQGLYEQGGGTNFLGFQLDDTNLDFVVGESATQKGHVRVTGIQANVKYHVLGQLRQYSPQLMFG